MLEVPPPKIRACPSNTRSDSFFGSADGSTSSGPWATPRSRPVWTMPSRTANSAKRVSNRYPPRRLVVSLRPWMRTSMSKESPF